MRILFRYILLYLAAAFFFVLYNHILDLIFYSLDYGTVDNLISGLGYVGYFIALYSPVFLPFMILYNIVINKLFFKNETSKQRLLRYGVALFLGLSIGLLIGKSGISFYIGKYRYLKSIFLFGLILFSIELTRDIVVNLRYKQSLK